MKKLSLFAPALLLFFVATTAFFAFLGPRVPVANGLGWDGQVYGKCAIDLAGCIESRTLSAYNMGRLFPSALVHALFRLFGVRADVGSVVMTFSLLNLAAIWASVLLWLDVGRRQGWQQATTLFGIAALFFNFSVMRLPFYAPVYTDTIALLFGMFALWCFATGRARLSLALLPPAAFTWPPAIPAIACIAVLGRRQGEDGDEDNHAGLLGALCVAVFLASVWYFVIRDPKPQEHGAAQIQQRWLAVSVAISAAYVFWATRNLRLSSVPRKLSFDWVSIVILAVLLAAYAAASVALARFAGTPSAMNAEVFLRGLVETGLVYPAAFLVAHVAFVGPWILVFIALIPHIVRTAARHAIALYPVIACVLLFILMSQTRFMTFFLPIAVFVLCMTIDGMLSTIEAAAFALLALILSHFWLPMAGATFDQLLEFPAQVMFMHIGPWTGQRGYALGLLQLVLASIVVAPMIRRIHRSIRQE